MALTSSLYSGVSGLVNMGNAMQVIGDNISNTNTTGFKAARATFQDIMAQSINTARGGSQVGRGSAMSDVAPLFIQGSFESTSSPTDLAIAGNGFFMVTDPKVENSIYFTRAGQFHVDKLGYLVNPAGLRVQGWGMETQPDGSAEIVGAIKDVQLTTTSPPVATSQSTIAVNLDSRVSGPVDARSLETAWVQKKGELSPDVDYEYKTTINVFDSVGNTHELSVYFDRTHQDREWEFLVTMSPEEDKNIFATAPDVPPDNRGILMRGYIHFTPQGSIDGIYSKHIAGIGEVTSSTNTQYANSSFYSDGTGTSKVNFRIEDIEDLPTPLPNGSTYTISDQPHVWLEDATNPGTYQDFYVVAFDPEDDELTLADASGNPQIVAKYSANNDENIQRFGTRILNFHDPSGAGDIAVNQDIDTTNNKLDQLELDDLYRIDPNDDTTWIDFNDSAYTITAYDHDNMTVTIRDNSTSTSSTYQIRPTDIRGDWFDVSYGNHNYPELKAYFLPPTGQVLATTGEDLSAQMMEIDFGAFATVNQNNDGSFDPPTKWTTEAITTTQYANRSSTLFYDQNGFGPGFLESVNVDSEGIISGSYSNGRIISLAQLGLARFNSPTDLSKEGGNLWRETTASGSPITGPPRTNGLGSIAANALEQSTVDMGTEFVKLITTQRAFQANSRVITTTDDMLNELLNMKR